MILIAVNGFAPAQVTRFLAFEVIPASGAAALAGLVGLAGVRRRR
jgi:uncharacterized protein (TIGR03382 family)